ncbi:TonB-dependent receptor [Reichenbachiella sp.]|uniref:TonB-dependent receptor n=1 Tax=Reichenbachiella sp. TaxID=2184521 RepID=UPI003B5A2D05
MQKVLWFFVGFQIVTWTAAAQSVSGTVVDEKGEALPGSTILIVGTNTGGIADMNGKFSLKEIKAGTHQIKISTLGHLEQIQTVVIAKGKTTPLHIVMKTDATSLDEVTIEAKSEVTELREQTFAITAIDAEPLKIQNLDVNQILNTTTGVRIREEGGLGSNFDFSLNGFSGSQVKFFIDDIPMDYFGSSLSLNNIPVNLISKIEVYKGVVPVHLGSDALGGAVNVTTDRGIQNYLNASYSIGSFNTHRAAIVGRVTTDHGLVVKANGFFNYSDNNYTVTAEVVDTNSGKVTEQDVERFHDGYQSQTLQLEVGVENKPFADRLFVGVIVSSNEKEIQTGFNLTNVVGEANTTDKVLIPTLKYQKNDLMIEGLDLRFNATYKYGESMRIDTSSRKYNWLGEFSTKDVSVNSGEISWDKTLFRFDDNAFLASANISYEINDQQAISLNNNYSYYNRVGDDPIAMSSVPFKEPNTLEKNITGLAYSLNLLDNRLKTVTFGKLFYLNALTRTETDEDELVPITNSDLYKGFGIAATYFFTDGLQAKISYENTYRLPEVLELFGNGLQIYENPTLQPEKSQNYNISFLGRKRYGENEFLVEVGYLYRLPENLIRNHATGNESAYENLLAAKANIFEGGIKYNYKRILNIEVNGTYQKIVNDTEINPLTGGTNYLYEAQVPNMPILFGNAKVGVLFDQIGHETGKLGINWSTAFVEEFFLKWPINGDKETKADIPRQLSHNLSASYTWLNGKYNLSLSCTNLMNEKLYDNFLLQKPGRAYNLKLSYFLQ